MLGSISYRQQNHTEFFWFHRDIIKISNSLPSDSHHMGNTNLSSHEVGAEIGKASKCWKKNAFHLSFYSLQSSGCFTHFFKRNTNNFIPNKLFWTNMIIFYFTFCHAFTIILFILLGGSTRGAMQEPEFHCTFQNCPFHYVLFCIFTHALGLQVCSRRPRVVLTVTL